MSYLPAVILLFAAARPGAADAQVASPPAPAAPGSTPDDSVLGTVAVTGASAAPLPKLAVVPLITTSDADTTFQLVVRRDLDLSGQFDVMDDSAAPKGLYLHDQVLDVAAWRTTGADALVRVVADRAPGGKVDLSAAAFLVARGKDPVFTRHAVVDEAKVRAESHRMADALLGALTGKSGGFASHMVYTSRVGSGTQVFGIDADGFDLHAASPPGETAIAPAFGPSDEIWWARSRRYDPFELVRGDGATPVPLAERGSVLGLAFSPDRTKLAVAIASDGASRVWVGPPDGTSLAPVSSEPLANHPAFGPGGRLAYVAGGTAGQRVYVDGKPISPAGFSASAPVFCDTPNGVEVVFTVGVGKGADLVATDVRGGGLVRLTQGQGANAYPACSPDGRLLAFFSTRTSDKGPGLYVVPIAAPWRSRRISSELGESLRWEALPSR